MIAGNPDINLGNKIKLVQGRGTITRSTFIPMKSGVVSLIDIQIKRSLEAVVKYVSYDF